MSLRRSIVFAALALSLAACHDEEFVTVVAGPPPTNFTGPSSATGLTGFDEEVGAADVGGDGLPRLVFVRTVGSNKQVLFTRRTSTGAWTSPLSLSVQADDAHAKSSISAFVTTSNDFTHVFWLDGTDSEVHYARVNNADPPALDGSDTVISGISPATAASLVTAVDRVSNTVFAAWIETTAISGGIPIVGEVAAAGPAFGNWFSLVTPGAGACVSSSPLLRISSSGVAHAAWVGTLLDGSQSRLRYSQRASAGVWTASPGETISDAANASDPQLLLAGDGDVYAVWYDTATFNILADRRPSAGAFGSDVLVKDYLGATTVSLRAALEPNAEILHVIWREGAVPGAVSFLAQRQDAADLGGNWLIADETILTVTTAAGNSVDFAAWADSTDRVIVAYQAPPVAGDLSRTRLQIHTSGAPPFGAATDLTASFVLPCSGLAVVANGSGTALLVWEQGNGDALPLSDVIGAVYAAGGGVGGAANISQSASTGSRAPFALRMTESNAGHVFWHETTAVGLRDIDHAQTQ